MKHLKSVSKDPLVKEIINTIISVRGRSCPKFKSRETKESIRYFDILNKRKQRDTFGIPFDFQNFNLLKREI